MSKALIISGLPYGGKSHLLAQLASRPAYAGVPVVRLDETYRRLFGDRKDSEVSREEHLMKNAAWRAEVVEKALAHPLVLAEGVLLTRDGHQAPLQAALAERHIEMAVVLVFASPETVERRAKGAHDSPVQGLEATRQAYLQYEFPETYEPLYIDTTGESAEAEAGRANEILEFLRAGKIDAGLNARRKRDAIGSFEAIKNRLGIR